MKIKLEDVRDYIEDNTSDDDICEYLNDVYGAVDIPIIGKMEVGNVVYQLADETYWGKIFDDIVTNEAENVEYELEHYGKSYWNGEDLELDEDEEEEN